MKTQKILLLIFIVGLALRLFNLPSYIFQNYGYDQARDFLVARHIYTYGEQVHRGPDAFGSLKKLTNSVGYYYFVTFILFFTRSPFLFSFVMALGMSLQILIAYKVGEILIDKKIGLVFALLVSFSPELIYQSKTLYQPHLLPFCMLLFLYCMVKKNHTYYYDFSAAALFLLLPLHFHYGVLLILPVGSLWLFHNWWTYFSKSKKTVKDYFPVIIFALLIWHWVYSTYTKAPFDQLAFVSANVAGTTFTTIQSQLIATFTLFTKLIWHSADVVSLVTSATVAFFVPLLFLIKKSHSERVNIVWISAIQLSLLLSLFFKAKIYDTYFSSFIPTYLFLLSSAVGWVTTKNKALGIFALMLILTFFMYGTYQKESEISAIGPIYPELKAMTALILKDTEQKQLNQHPLVKNFTISLLAGDDTFGHDGWGTTPIWFILEKTAQQKLVTITDDRFKANFEPDTELLQYVYFICEHRSNYPENSEERCLNKFYFNRPFLSRNLTTLYTSENFTLWVIEFVDYSPNGFYQHYDVDKEYPKQYGFYFNQ
jgi:hypothetical protein